MLSEAQAMKARLIELRRKIHRQPELGFGVHRTAELVARSLAELGIEAQTGVGKTGVVAYLGESDGPVVAVRADMDALPIQEVNQVDYASQAPGLMHACGHDAHTAMLLGVATLLARRKLPGQVRLIFQPSEEMSDEEGISGAPRMIADGALEGVQAVIALHVDGTLEAGKISVETGKVSGTDATFRGHVRGRGGHGARPDKALDTIWLANQVMNALFAVPARRIDPFQPSVLSLGVVHGGTASNVIPDDVYLEGTVRAMDEAVREQLIEEVRRCFEVARALGGDYALEFEMGYASMNNDAGVVETMRAVGREMLGPDQVTVGKPVLGVEDFGYMTALSRGAMFSLGVRQPGGPPRFVHTPDFDIDEDALPIGAAMLAATAVRLLEEAGEG